MEKFKIVKSGLYLKNGYFHGPIEFSNRSIKVQLWLYGKANPNEKFGGNFELKDNEIKFWNFSYYHNKWISTCYDEKSQKEIWNQIAEDTDLFNKLLKELAIN